MQVPFLQVDAFADRPFAGNPAAVVFVEQWPDDSVMAAIAAENNLSETAFLVRKGPGRYDLRWFTPTVEVDLCGHATLASGFAVLEREATEQVVFETRSGELVVRRAGGDLEMALPALPPVGKGKPPPAVVTALGSAPDELWALRKVHYADYWLAVYDSVARIDALAPDVRQLGELGCNVICTAAGGESGVDFVSRFFAPASGVDEDPVTGSAHCSLAPFWAERLGRNPLRAHQRSARGGRLTCEVQGDRVVLRGSCVRVIEGTLFL